MSGISIWQIIILLGFFLIGVVPWVLVLCSSAVRGGEKFAWFLFAFFFSWVGYLIFYIVAARKNSSAA